MTPPLKTYLNFIWAAVVRPGQVGGIIPSQRILIDKMIAPIPETYDGWIVELGTGSGALTLRLAKQCPQAKILAFEINPTLAQDNRDNLARARVGNRVEVITGPAKHLLLEMGRRGIAKVDYVVSGIPLGSLGKRKVVALLHVVNQVLSEGGLYIQFQHSLLDRRKIKRQFHNIRSVPVLLNFPPAVVYYAKKTSHRQNNYGVPYASLRVPKSLIAEAP